MTSVTRQGTIFNHEECRELFELEQAPEQASTKKPKDKNKVAKSKSVEMEELLQKLEALVTKLDHPDQTGQEASIHKTVLNALTTHDAKKEPVAVKPPQSVINLFQPAPFSGNKDTDVQEFLDLFDEFATQAKFEGAAKIKLLGRFLTNQAQAWFKALPKEVQATYDLVKADMILKFGTDSLSYAEKQVILNRQYS